MSRSSWLFIAPLIVAPLVGTQPPSGLAMAERVIADKTRPVGSNRGATLVAGKDGSATDPQPHWNPEPVLSRTDSVDTASRTQKKGAQSKAGKPVRLYHFGLINGLLGGLYDGLATYQSLKEQGSFGLGAPDRLDGELTILDGQVYQTQASGRTFVPSDTAKMAYAFVHPFRVDTTFHLTGPIDKVQVEAFLDQKLTEPNGLYAVRLTGQFRAIRTRAFPPVTQKPYAAMAAMMARQRFFELETVSGDLVGYRLPSFMNGVNVPGYHFHFLSQDRSHGGHVLAYTSEYLRVQIQQLDGYVVDIPKTADYRQFDFKHDRQVELKQVETGVKNEK